MEAEGNAEVKKVEIVKTPVAEPEDEAYTEMVYCGPTLPRIAKQFTVYKKGLPKALLRFMRAHSAARGLVVPLERFAEVRKALDDPESAVSALYQEVASGL